MNIKEESELDDTYFLPTRIYATGDGQTPPPPEGTVNTVFEGRIALESGQAEEARRFFEKASIAESDIASRARRFNALTHPEGSKSRLEALLSLEPSTDVILEVIEIDLKRGLNLVPARSIPYEDDPTGWFLWKAATLKPGNLDTEDRSRFLGEVGQHLLQTTRLNLLALAERFARQQGLSVEAESFNSRRRDLAVAEADRLFKEGLAAGAEGRYHDAADAFWKANSLEPGEELTMRLLLIALMEIGDDARVERLIEQFRFIGKSESHIRTLVDEVRSGKMVFRGLTGKEASVDP